MHVGLFVCLSACRVCHVMSCHVMSFHLSNVQHLRYKETKNETATQQTKQMLSMLQRSIRTRQTDHFVVCVCMSVPLSAVLNAPALHRNKTICSVRVLSWPAPRRPRQWPCWSSGGASSCPTMRLCDAPDVTISRCACVM